MGITEDYFKHTKEGKKNYGERTMIFMQVGSFFECYAVEEKDGSYTGSNIRELAESNDLTIARKNSFIENGKQVLLCYAQIDEFCMKNESYYKCNN